MHIQQKLAKEVAEIYMRYGKGKDKYKAGGGNPGKMGYRWSYKILDFMETDPFFICESFEGSPHIGPGSGFFR